MTEQSLELTVEGLDLRYRDAQILHAISATFRGPGAYAIAGPSGCGKSSFLRCIDRLNDEIPGSRMTGSITLRSADAELGILPELRLHKKGDAHGIPYPIESLRRLAGMVFQTPRVLPVSILRNITMPMALQKKRPADELTEGAVSALKAAALWDDVKNRLGAPAAELSGGQQQRLCIARMLALEPKMLLFDEPTASLDIRNAALIEDLMLRLAETRLVIYATHSPAQALKAKSLLLMRNGRLDGVIGTGDISQEELERLLRQEREYEKARPI